jgi:hypothetical protein
MQHGWPRSRLSPNSPQQRDGPERGHHAAAGRCDDSNVFCQRTARVGVVGGCCVAGNTCARLRQPGCPVGCAKPTIFDNVHISQFGIAAGRQSFTSGECSGDELFQGLFAFNVDRVKVPVQKAIFSATLSDNPTCLTTIGLSRDNWATGNPKTTLHLQGIDPQWVLPLDIQGHSVIADVTWMFNRQPHFVGADTGTLWEFVAEGQTAQWGDQLPTCFVQLQDVQLQVTQFK